MLQQPQFSPPSAGQNFHFVGVPENIAPTFPPLGPFAKGTPSPPAPSDKQGTPRGRNVTSDIHSDDGGATARTTKTKKHWTHDEEVRLVIRAPFFY